MTDTTANPVAPTSLKLNITNVRSEATKNGGEALTPEQDALAKAIIGDVGTYTVEGGVHAGEVRPQCTPAELATIVRFMDANGLTDLEQFRTAVGLHPNARLFMFAQRMEQIRRGKAYQTMADQDSTRDQQRRADRLITIARERGREKLARNLENTLDSAVGSDEKEFIEGRWASAGSLAAMMDFVQKRLGLTDDDLWVESASDIAPGEELVAQGMAGDIVSTSTPDVSPTGGEKF